jgi:uncharacterized protein (DUF1015 family)
VRSWHELCQPVGVARFEPFTGIRYEPNLPLDQVTAPPYDVLSPADRAAFAARHRANVVHVDLPLESDGSARYERAADVFRSWLADGTLVRDERPAFYRHQMSFRDETGGARSTTGFVGGIEVVPRGETGGVLPHEQTTPKAKTDRLDLTRATETNLSSVWGLSMANGFASLLDLPATAVGEFVDDDSVRHQLAVVDDAAAIERIRSVIGSADVLIADGHHRYDVARTYQAEQRAVHGNNPGPWDLTMTYVIELAPDALFVQAIHRLISSVPTDVDLRVHLARWFTLEAAGPVGPSMAADVVTKGALCLVAPDSHGTFLVPRAAAFAGLRDLDSLRLEAALADLTHEKRYQHGVDHVLAALAVGEAQWGVLLRPVPIAEIRRTATEGALMPPKSTFFAPKPRTGLVIRPLT